MHSAQRTTRSHVHGAGGERGAGRERKGGRTHRLVVTRIHHVRVAGSKSRVLPGLFVEERVVVLDVDLHGLVYRHGWISLFPGPRGGGFDSTRTAGVPARAHGLTFA